MNKKPDKQRNEKHYQQAGGDPGACSRNPNAMGWALREAVERQRFTGWSAAARAAGGVLALAAAAILAMPGYPRLEVPQADGWGWLALAVFTINAVALGIWYARLPRGQRHPRRLAPVVHGLLPFLVTCAVSIAMIMRYEFQYLPGLWMCGYGLVNLSLHHVMNRGIRLVGLYYVLCGTAALLLFPYPFTNPWPMGLTFFTGELLGACALFQNRGAGNGLVVALEAADAGKR